MTEPTPDCPEVRTGVVDGVATLELDRPKAINALTPEMMLAIGEALRAWREDPSVASVELWARGERGFCAGADVRAIRQLVLDDPAAAVGFFEHEYEVNLLIATCTKPVTSHLFGISMGGGLGLACHAHRVVARGDLQLAMPEVGIGLFPDVGMTHQLARTPGLVGRHLAMTGATVGAADALFAGLVDEVVGADGSPVAPGDSTLAADQAWIDECYAASDPVSVVVALEQHADPRAQEAAAVIRTRSPWSVSVALEAVRRAEGLDVAGVLRQDLALARSFVADSDFVEGVRAQLVDKDRDPHWRHARLEDVPRELVEQMFG